MTSPVTLLVPLVLAVTASWPHIRHWYYLRHYPLLHRSKSWRERVTKYMTSAGSLLIEGGEKFGESPYRLTSANGEYHVRQPIIQVQIC